MKIILVENMQYVSAADTGCRILPSESFQVVRMLPFKCSRHSLVLIFPDSISMHTAIIKNKQISFLAPMKLSTDDDATSSVVFINSYKQHVWLFTEFGENFKLKLYL